MSPSNTPKRAWKVAAVFAGILLLHCLANAYWISRDTTLRGNDMGPHIQGVGLAHSWFLQEGLGQGVKRITRGKSPIYWPGAGYLVWGAPALVFGRSVEAQRAYNLIFLGLMMASLLFIGRRIHSWRAGLLAAALVPLYPGIFGEGRQVGNNFPEATMVAVCIALLLSTRGFRVIWRTVALAVCVGLATLIRPQANFFLVVPIVLAFGWGMVRHRGMGRLWVAVSGALALVAVLAVSSVWWWGNLGEIYDELTRHQQGVREHDGPPGGGGYGFAAEGSSFLFYLRAIVLSASPFLLGILGVALAALGIDAWRKRKSSPTKNSAVAPPGPPGPEASPPPSPPKNSAVSAVSAVAPPDLLLIAAWLLGGFAVISLIKVHMLRYMIALLPGLALVTALGLMSLRQQRLRRAAVGLVLLGAGVGWLFGTVDIAGFPLPQVRSLVTAKIDKSEPYVPSGPPLNNPYTYTLERVVQVLRARHDTGRGVLLRLVMDHKDVDELIVRWAAAPILGVNLPELRVTEQRFPEYILNRPRDGTRGELINFTSIPYPDRPAPIRHCYTLRMFTSRTAAPAGNSVCKRVLDIAGALSPLEDPRPIRLTLYHYPKCPLSICELEGKDPRGPLPGPPGQPGPPVPPPPPPGHLPPGHPHGPPPGPAPTPNP